jgi:hypothetical protein
MLSGNLERHVPKAGWPPNTSPDDYRVSPASVDVPHDDVSNTFLGQLLAKQGVKL